MTLGQTISSMMINPFIALGAFIESLFMPLWLLNLWRITDTASLAAPLHLPTNLEMNDTWPNDFSHDDKFFHCIGSLHQVPLHATLAAQSAAEHRYCQSGSLCCPIALPHKLRNE
jgi:hypothetical protein